MFSYKLIHFKVPNNHSPYPDAIFRDFFLNICGVIICFLLYVLLNFNSPPTTMPLLKCLELWNKHNTKPLFVEKEN